MIQRAKCRKLSNTPRRTLAVAKKCVVFCLLGLLLCWSNLNLKNNVDALKTGFKRCFMCFGLRV